MKQARTLHLLALTLAGGLAMGASCSQQISDVAGNVGRGNIGDMLSGSGDKTASVMKAGGTAFDTATLASDVQRQRDIGESLAVSLCNSPGLVNDASLTDYVIKVGLTVASACSRDDIEFTFGVLDTDAVNAYSAPQGFVFITRGALAQMEDEAELAGALAHEIGHIARDHGIQTLTRQGTLKTTVTAATAGRDAQLAELMEASVDTLLNTSWNHPQETEADLEAVKYLKAAGYDPQGFLRFLTRLPESGEALNSHPRTSARIERVKQEIGTHRGGAALAGRFRAATTR